MAAVGVVASAATAAAFFVVPSGTAAATPSPMVLASGSLPMTLVHTAGVHGGDVVTTWQGNGVQVRSAGLSGSHVGASFAGKDTMRAWTDPPASAPRSARQYARSGRSVYWDALAAGMSKAQAVKTTLELGDRVPAAAHVSARARYIRPRVFYSACTTVYGGSDLIYGTACLQQSYLESKPGAYYLDNQIVSSGSSSWPFGNSLTNLDGYYCWCGSGYTYTRVGWSPSASITEGSPTTYTLTAGYGGFTVAVQETQYPATLSPIFPSGVTEPAFGSEWSGSNLNGIVDSANSVAIVHEGPGAPGPAIIHVGITWS